MNRRKVLSLIFVAGGATVTGIGGYKWFQLNKAVDIGFLDQKMDLLAALAETIIPKTNTPGAREAGVGDFIYLMINECTDLRTKNKFVEGLHDLEAYCTEQYNKSYTGCTEAEQVIVMRHFQKKGRPMSGILGKAQNKFLGKSFFTTLKEFTVKGYCTSELGATKGLGYIAIPGVYKGCVDLSKGQRSWATK
jgi:hypothetical protein